MLSKFYFLMVISCVVGSFMAPTLSASDITPSKEPTLAEVRTSWKKGVEYYLWMYEKSEDDGANAPQRILDILKDGSVNFGSGNTPIKYGIRNSGPSDDELSFMIKALYVSAWDEADSIEGQVFEVDKAIIQSNLNKLLGRVSHGHITKDAAMHSLIVFGLYYAAVDDCIAAFHPGKQKDTHEKAGKISWDAIIDYLGTVHKQFPNDLPAPNDVQAKVTFLRNAISGTPDLKPNTLAQNVLKKYGQKPGAYPKVHSLDDARTALEKMNLDLTNTLVFLDTEACFDDIYGSLHGDDDDQKKRDGDAKSLQVLVKELSKKRAVFSLLDGRGYEKTNQSARKMIGTLAYPIKIQGFSTITGSNGENRGVNPAGRALSDGGISNANHPTVQIPLGDRQGVYYINDGSNPILFTNTRALHQGESRKGLIATAMKNLLQSQNIVQKLPRKFTIVMLHKDPEILSYVQTELEKLGFTFIGLKKEGSLLWGRK